jgi:hypothetical protein
MDKARFFVIVLLEVAILYVMWKAYQKIDALTSQAKSVLDNPIASILQKI